MLRGHRKKGMTGTGKEGRKMETVVSVVRTEKKYSITRSKQSVLLHRLSSVMRPDENGGTEGYWVRSLYFDSIYDGDYFDKINGLEFRKKIRLRIYSPDQETVKLELKQKQGAAQKKKSLLMTRGMAEELIQGNYLGLMDLRSQLAAEFYLLLETGVYRPKCIVEYHRIAFAEEANDIRVTFDSEIGTSHNSDAFFSRELSLLPVRKEPVLEVKYNGFLLGSIKELLDYADAPELSISKYTMSRQVLGA